MDKVTADLFCGEWIDSACRFLQVRVSATGRLSVSCLGPNRKPITRRLLDGESPSLEMPARLDGERLEVELGMPGLGPTLCLTYLDGPPRLVPEVRMGLYDDWEDDFGVPWLFPLSTYRKPTSKERAT